MKLNITSSLGTFDKNLYLIAIQKHVKEVFIKGMRAFLLAASPRIPVRTGFARSALNNLEDLAGKVTTDAQSGGYRIRGTKGGGTRAKSSNQYYYPPGGQRVLKTNQSGRKFATDSGSILNATGASLAKGRTAFYFKFSVDISYFDVLDRSVWKAFDAGTKAMEQYIESNLSKGFPEFGKFLTRKTT